MNRIQKIIDAYNNLERAEMEPLPEYLRHPAISEDEAREASWVRIPEADWFALKPLLAAQVTFRVHWDEASDDYVEYDRNVVNDLGALIGDGWAWVSSKDALGWRYMVRELILMIAALGDGIDRWSVE